MTKSKSENNNYHRFNEYAEVKKNLKRAAKKHLHRRGNAEDVIIGSLLLGLVVGIIFEKSRLVDTGIVGSQLQLGNFISVKLLLTAAASGQLCIGLWSCSKRQRLRFLDCRHHTCRYHGIKPLILGSIIQGAGISISMSSPALVFAQIGSGEDHARYVLIGCCIGAIVYGLLERRMEKNLFPSGEHKPLTLDEVAKKPFYITALLFAALAMGVIVFVETLVPWRSEIGRMGAVAIDSSYVYMTMDAWAPYVCGALLGAVQLPLIYLVDHTISTTDSFMTFAAQLQRYLPQTKREKSFERFSYGLYKNIWQAIFVLGIIFGARMSGSISGTLNTPLSHPSSLSVMRYIFGGILLLFGARLSNGCLLSHAVSGAHFVSIASFLASTVICITAVLFYSLLSFWL